VGGSPTSRTIVGILLPPCLASHRHSLLTCPPYPTQPWRLILNALDSLVSGPSTSPPTFVSGGGPCIHRSQLALLPWGLFPHDDPSAVTACPCIFNTTKWTQRPLTPLELGSLWDLPLRLLDLARTSSQSSFLLPFFNTPPAKLLHSGADLLLSFSLLGEGTYFSSSRGAKRPPDALSVDQTCPPK
jgi:hypothetical protein